VAGGGAHLERAGTVSADASGAVKIRNALLAAHLRDKAQIWEEGRMARKMSDDNGERNEALEDMKRLVELQMGVIMNLVNAVEKLAEVITEATEPDEDEDEDKAKE
jgi:hypothetical protein